MSDYLEYRGKCKELSEEAIKQDPTLTLVRGFYYEPLWNREEQHWWCKDTDGNIVDPTRKQFPSGGIKENYREFSGFYNCEQCGKEVHEDEASVDGHHIFCSGECHMRCVGF